MMCGWDAKEPQVTQSTCQPCIGRVITQQSINIDRHCCLSHAGARWQKRAFFPVRHLLGQELCSAWWSPASNEMSLGQVSGRKYTGAYL